MAVTDKKQLRKNIEIKLEKTFVDLAHTADKKFKKLVKKVSRLLADGLHHKPKKVAQKKSKQAKKSVEKSPIDKPTPKKATPKKSTPKKTAGKK